MIKPHQKNICQIPFLIAEMLEHQKPVRELENAGADATKWVSVQGSFALLS